MLKTIAFACALITLHLHSSAQSCLPDGIFITRQGQIDSFTINYPGCVILEEDIRISGQDIVNLNGLSHIEVIDGTLWIIVTALTDFNDLSSLKSIGSLRILSNANLTNLHFLHSFDSLDLLELSDSPLLTDYTGISNLEYAGYVSLTKLPLTDIDIFPSLKNFKTIVLNNLPNLVSISEFPAQSVISSLQQKITITNNPLLQDLGGLLGWTKVHTLEIDNNDNLTNLHGLNTIREINWLDLLYNDVLTDISALASCKEIATTIIQSNATLPNIHGLENLKNGFFHIENNPLLTNVDAFKHMSHIRGIYLYNIPIVDLTGLESIDTIFGNLYLKSNSSLSSLKGLDSLKFLSGSFSITSNPILSECHNAFVCHHIELGNPTHISDNTLGCNSIPEVIAQCNILSDEWIENETITCYPNPTSGIFEIHGLREENPVIQIIDNYGIQDRNWTQNGRYIDLTSSAAGCFSILISTDSGFVVRRLIKL